MAEEAVKNCFVSAGCTMTERSGKFRFCTFGQAMVQTVVEHFAGHPI
jgi:hypothetical protein